MYDPLFGHCSLNHLKGRGKHSIQNNQGFIVICEYWHRIFRLESNIEFEA